MNQSTLDLSIPTQPDGISCGPTCLCALYHYFQDDVHLDTVINEAPSIETGGTLAILLGCHALERGYQATLHTLNLHVIDPTWFKEKNINLLDKLRTQLLHAKSQKMLFTTKAYIKFLELGGKIKFEEITFDLLRNYLDNAIPLLSGVSATYLYQNMRDYTSAENKAVYDEWLGEPSGHFIILRGYEKEKLHIADPYTHHPLSNTNYYTVTFAHWLHAHLLGIISYDAELLAIQPRGATGCLI